MAHNLTIFPSSPASTTVQVPDGGDPRTAASVDSPFQSIANMIGWLYGVLTGTISQAVSILGALHSTGDISTDGNVNAGVLLYSPTVVCNSLSANSIVAPRRIAFGALTTGVHTFDPTTYEHIFVNPLGGGVASGCIWRIASGTYPAGFCIKFVTNDTTNSIAVQDPSGTTLATIKSASGFILSCTLCFLGGNWSVCDSAYHS